MYNSTCKVWAFTYRLNGERSTGKWTMKNDENLYFKIGSVCLSHGQHAIGDRRYFLAPCDKHKHTGHSQQQAASQASTDSA